MLSYKDMTFCYSNCTNKECIRHKSRTEKNTRNLPVSMCDFSANCEEYTSAEKQKTDNSALLNPVLK